MAGVPVSEAALLMVVSPKLLGSTLGPNWSELGLSSCCTLRKTWVSKGTHEPLQAPVWGRGRPGLLGESEGHCRTVLSAAPVTASA